MGDMDNLAHYPGWETVRKIGTGSFGTVYEIERDLFGKKEKAALKLISIPQNESDIDELYGNGFDDASITAHFQNYLADIVREYSLMAEMKGHTNVVYCDDIRYVQHDDGFGWDIYIKMELLTPMMKALGKEVTDEQVIKLGRDICNALVLCKSRNIIHRDIKPQNIFISNDGDYKLGDFGIAKTAEKTSGGTKIGTYNYMAPEVYNNEPYGHAADIYSLGLVMYWLLNERRMPFNPLPPAVPTASEMDEARLRRFQGEPLPPPAHGSEALKRIVLKACAYDPKNRYQSAAEMLSALESIGKPAGQEPVFPAQQAEEDDDPTEGFGWKAKAPEPEEEKTVGAWTKPKIEPEPEEDKTVGAWTKPEKEPEEEKTTGVWAAPEQSKTDGRLNENGKPRKKIWLPILVIGILLLGAAAIFFIMSNSAEMPAQETLPEFRLIRQTQTYMDGSSDVTEYVYDENGNRTEGNTYRNGELLAKYIYHCNESGEILLYDVYFPLDESTPDTVAYEYDQDGRTVKENIYSSGKLSRRNEFGYDSEGHRNKWDTTYFDENGNVQSVSSQQYDGYACTQVIRTMPDGTSIVLYNAEQVFDEQERLVQDSRYFADDGELFSKRTYQYDEYGNLIVETNWQKARGMEASSISIAYEYVKLGTETAVNETKNELFGEETFPIVEISAGAYHTVGLKSDGTVVAVGNNVTSQCNVSNWSDIVAISAGENHTVGLKSDGTVVATGSISFGQCDVSGWSDIVAISAGSKYTLGLHSDGTVVAAGCNDYGQCDVSGWSDIVAISAGFFHTVGLKSDGTVVAVGKNYSGQCNVCDWSDIVSISAGHNYTVGLRADGTVVAVGENDYGQCEVSDWRDIVSISAGSFHTAALRVDGTVAAVGYNELGQCEVSDWRDVVSVSVGTNHTMGLRADGTVLAVGDNNYGQCDVSDW